MIDVCFRYSNTENQIKVNVKPRVSIHIHQNLMLYFLGDPLQKTCLYYTSKCSKTIYSSHCKSFQISASAKCLNLSKYCMYVKQMFHYSWCIAQISLYWEIQQELFTSSYALTFQSSSYTRSCSGSFECQCASISDCVTGAVCTLSHFSVSKK